MTNKFHPLINTTEELEQLLNKNRAGAFSQGQDRRIGVLFRFEKHKQTAPTLRSQDDLAWFNLGK